MGLPRGSTERRSWSECAKLTACVVLGTYAASTALGTVGENSMTDATRLLNTMNARMAWDAAAVRSRLTPLPALDGVDGDERDEYGHLTLAAQCSALETGGRDPGWPLRDPHDDADGGAGLGFESAHALCDAMRRLPSELRVYSFPLSAAERRRYALAELAPTFNRGYDVEGHIVRFMGEPPFHTADPEEATAFLLPARPYLERVAAYRIRARRHDAERRGDGAPARRRGGGDVAPERLEGEGRRVRARDGQRARYRDVRGERHGAGGERQSRVRRVQRGFHHAARRRRAAPRHQRNGRAVRAGAFRDAQGRERGVQPVVPHPEGCRDAARDDAHVRRGRGRRAFELDPERGGAPGDDVEFPRERPRDSASASSRTSGRWDRGLGPRARKGRSRPRVRAFAGGQQVLPARPRHARAVAAAHRGDGVRVRPGDHRGRVRAALRGCSIGTRSPSASRRTSTSGFLSYWTKRTGL